MASYFRPIRTPNPEAIGGKRREIASRRYRFNRVADLVDRDLGPNDLRYLRTESIATNAVEYIKLHMAELALPPET